MPIWLPLISLYTVWRNFKSTYSVSELNTYNFSDQGYTTTSESCNSKIDWAKIYKVKIIKGWLILYHSRTAANMVKIDPAANDNIEALKKCLKEGTFKETLKW